MLRRPACIVLAGAAVCAAALALRQPAAARPEGEALLARLQCTACHDAPAETLARLKPLGAPDLARIGARAAPAGLRAWLAAPHAGTSRMPDLLHGLTDSERAEAIEDLVHFLASLGGPFQARAVRVDAWRPDAGEELVRRLACAACHPASDWKERALDARYDLLSLAEFLRDPQESRPAGAMPDFGLSAAEAEAIASFLLRSQLDAGPARIERRPGVAWRYYEYPTTGPLPPDLDSIPESEPVLEGVAERVGLQPGRRSDRFLYRFEGWLELERAALVEFGLESDDGSRLKVDGEVVVDNDGHHAAVLAEADARLEAGLHRVEVEMFEAGGEEALAAWICVRGSEGAKSEPLGAAQLTVPAPVYEPLGAEAFVPDSARAERGRERFAALGCADCHAGAGPSTARPAPAVESLDPLRGCLADAPPAASPRYAWADGELPLLRETLRDAASLRRAATDAEAVAVALLRLDCVACHDRAGLGGPAPAQRAAFGGEGDLGDEGRLPPALDGVGAKLRREALERVLAGSGAARPYLHARMPVFAPAQLDGLAAAFDGADWRSGEDAPPSFDPALVEAGRALAGAGGLNCVQCHPVAGHAASGVQAMDMSGMSERLDWAWFRAWLRNPLAMRPSTRMPVFFAGGRSPARGILDGDAERQIAALWTWLSLGDGLPLPDGLVVEAGAFALTPAERPLYFGAFVARGSPRVLNVGFPERVHLAFDFEHARLMQVWRGDFMDAEGTWFGRAGALESPAGTDVRALPPGPAFARLDAPDALWPVASGHAGGWRALGHRRDERDRPTFRYASGAFTVEETLAPEYAEGGAILLRRFAVVAPPGEAWTLRAGLAERWEPAPDGSWRSGDGWTLRVTGAACSVRATPAGAELLAAVPHGRGTIEVLMSW